MTESVLPLPAEKVCVEFTLSRAGERVPCFVLRQGESLYGYVNSCPHTGVALNWQPGQFLDITGELIQCAMHGALFRIEDGVCLRGPCVGRSLQRLHLCREGEYLRVALPPA
jgi:nitrite reductase/ring-hydroxylating ferredoxin subunit